MRSDHRNFRDDTQANSEAVERVIQRLGYEQGELDFKSLLSHLPSPPPHAATHLRNRLLIKDSPRSRVSWTPIGALVMATVLCFWMLWPTPKNAPIEPVAHQNSPPVAPIAVPETIAEIVELPSDGPISMDLVDSGSLQARAISPGLSVEFSGMGRVEGTERSPHIVWHSGEISIDVDPQAGLAVTVETTDGKVRVLGTVFRVDRSALGMAVEVSRGQVEVHCKDQSSHRLMSGNQALCMPTSAAGMLGRARALTGQPEAVLEAIEQGLNLEGHPAVNGELRALQVDVLVELNRSHDAMAAARAYLELGGPRSLEISRTAAVLALQDGNCAEAIPFLEQIAPTQSDAASYLEDCKARTRTNLSQ